MFLAIDGIEGDSKNKGHVGQIDVAAFSWGGVVNTSASRAGSGSASGSSRPCPVNIVKLGTDRATPKILEAAATGQHIREVTLSVVSAAKTPAGEFTYAQYKFSDVEITNGGDAFGFVFQKAQVTYTPQRADGSADTPVTFAYDFSTNKEI
jgi:type VI secretion system secreted protein Hcp